MEMVWYLPLWRAFHFGAKRRSFPSCTQFRSCGLWIGSQLDYNPSAEVKTVIIALTWWRFYLPPFIGNSRNSKRDIFLASARQISKLLRLNRMIEFSSSMSKTHISTKLHILEISGCFKLPTLKSLMTLKLWMHCLGGQKEPKQTTLKVFQG